MSTIMKNDQSIHLVRLYHKYYLEITQHSQDMKGKQRKMDIWKSITEELNREFNTTYTTQQFKKKLENIKCTTRRKLHSNR